MPFYSNLLGSAGVNQPVTTYEISRSVRFNSADSAYLSRTPASAGNRKTWTWAGWVKRSGITTDWLPLFQVYDGSSFAESNFLQLAIYLDQIGIATNTVWLRRTQAVYRDYSAWMHVVCAFDTTQATGSDRVKIYVNGSQVTAFALSSDPTQNADYGINRAVAHQIGQRYGGQYFSGYLADIHFIDGQALDPTSFGEFDANGIWQPIEYTGTYPGNSFHLDFADNSTAAALGTDTSGNGNDWTVNNISAVVGNGSWIPMLSPTGGGTLQAPGDAFDGNILTAAAALTPLNPNPEGLKVTFSSTITAATSFKVYAQVTSSNPGESVQFYKNGSLVVTLPNDSQGDTTTAMVYDMGAGSYSSIEVREAAAYTGNAISLYGIEVDGVFLIDYSERKNDSLVDVPTNGTETDTGVGGEVRGNYCTWSATYAGAAGLSNGNLDYLAPATMSAFGSFSLTSGKWYWEFVNSGTGLSYVGIMDSTITSATDTSWSTQGRAYVPSGSKYDGSSTLYGASWTVGDVIGFALDLDVGTLTFYKNGVSQGVAFSTGLVGKEWKPFVYGGVGSGCSVNFGQRPFAYTAPSGFKALCTTNLPDPVIAKPSEVMDVKLYTGNGSTQTISGLGFSPDLVWIKNRVDAINHRLYDVVRGAANELIPDLTLAEATDTEGLSAFTSDGFSVGIRNPVNGNGDGIVAWTWDAGNTTVTNNDGSITSQVRANPSAGFSIVSYTGNGVAGATVGHGLGVAPEMIIIKNRDQADAWQVYHAANIANPETVYLVLDTPAGIVVALDRWNDTAPGASVFTLGDGVEVNTNTEDYVAYCFTGVSGYSSFGSYTGNGSAIDGPFVYTGFRPKWILVKASVLNNSWQIYDSARNAYNLTDNELCPDRSDAENGPGVTGGLDFLSNGFKVKSADSWLNTTSTYIYAAFAESPLALNNRAR